MHIQDIVARLGSHKQIQSSTDGSVVYRWYEPPENRGLGVRTTRTGEAFLVWVLNDPRYATKERLRAGNTEAEISAALGEPSRIRNVESPQRGKDLEYSTLGISFSINLEPRITFYNSVFGIGVFRAR